MHVSRNNLAAGLWIASLQYYAAQIIAAANWNAATGYSWLQNAISDLGNTFCGQYGERFVCSPLHGVMNASFIVLGLTMITGSILFAAHSVKLNQKLGYSCLILAGLGTILVGLYPENTVSALHVLGAALPFALGNLGIILIGTSFKSRNLKLFSVVIASMAFVALALLLTQNTGVAGFGGVERLVAYPQSIWMIIVGASVIKRKTVQI